MTILVLLGIWLGAAIGYSLWPDRPTVTIDHEFALGIAAVAIAGGVSSLLLVGRHRVLLATGIVSCLVGFGFLLELAQSKYAEVERSESIDVVLIALGSLIGVLAIWALVRAVGAEWTQRVVALFLITGSSLMLMSVLQSPQFDEWWTCDRLGIVSMQQPVVNIGPGVSAPEAVVAGEPQRLILDGATYDETEGALIFTGTGGATVASTNKAFCQLSDARDFTLRIEARTTDLRQSGPARLATISRGVEGHEIALHVGQDGSDLSVRVRTSPHRYNQVTVPAMFVDTDWHVFELRFHDGTLTIIRDDALVATDRLDTTELAGWELGWPLTLGNEATGDRPFSGGIKVVTITTDSATWTG